MKKKIEINLQNKCFYTRDCQNEIVDLVTKKRDQLANEGMIRRIHKRYKKKKCKLNII